MNKLISFLILLIFILPGFSQKAVPDFTVSDIYGHTHKLYSDYLNQNKYVFIDFFSVGCQSCSELSPVLDTVYRNFGCNYGDVVFLGIDGYYDNEHVFGFTQDYSMTFPAVSGNEGGGNQVFTDYNINYTPYKILIDPTGKIVADYPFEYTVKYYRDTLLNEGLKLQTCSGNNFLFYALNSDNDSITGTIDTGNKTINLTFPDNSDLTQLRAFFVAESNSTVKINGTEQISGETVNDFSQGALIYDITSEDGNTEQWTINVTTSSTDEIFNNAVSIFPNPVKNDFFIDFKDVKINNAEVKIYDTNGKLIKVRKIKNNTELIDISDFTEGIYFLKIYSEKFYFFKKIIKE